MSMARMVTTTLCLFLLTQSAAAIADNADEYQQNQIDDEARFDNATQENRGGFGGGGGGGGGFGRGGWGGGGFGGGFGPGRGGFGPRGGGFPGYLAQAPGNDDGIDYEGDALRRQRLSEPFGQSPSLWNPLSWPDAMRNWWRGKPANPTAPQSPSPGPSPSPSTPPAPPADPGGTGGAVGGGSAG